MDGACFFCCFVLVVVLLFVFSTFLVGWWFVVVVVVVVVDSIHDSQEVKWARGGGGGGGRWCCGLRGWGSCVALPGCTDDEPLINFFPYNLLQSCTEMKLSLGILLLCSAVCLAAPIVSTASNVAVNFYMESL